MIATVTASEIRRYIGLRSTMVMDEAPCWWMNPAGKVRRVGPVVSVGWVSIRSRQVSVRRSHVGCGSAGNLFDSDGDNGRAPHDRPDRRPRRPAPVHGLRDRGQGPLHVG